MGCGGMISNTSLKGLNRTKILGKVEVRLGNSRIKPSRF